MVENLGCKVGSVTVFHLFLRLPTSLSVRLYVHPFVHSPVCQSLRPSLLPSIQSSIPLLFRPSFRPSLHPSLRPALPQSTPRPVVLPSIHPVMSSASIGTRLASNLYAIFQFYSYLSVKTRFLNPRQSRCCFVPLIRRGFSGEQFTPRSRENTKLSWPVLTLHD